MAERAPNLSDLNPEFQSRLEAFRAALDKAGINYSLASGYRSPEYQGQMYANHLARQAGRALPYPDVEAPSVVAPAWRSFHNYGLAVDFSAANPADYARIRSMAPQYGLSGIGASDPGHIQMSGTLAGDINQYHLANWRPTGQPAPGQGAVAYGGPPAGQPPPTMVARTGAPSAGSSFFDALHQIESNNRNIYSGVDKDYPGQPNSRSQGYDQIDLPTWRQFAKQAGVDLTQYPTPMSAPPGVQDQVASQIPLSRFGQRTQNMLAHQFGQLDTSKTVGQLSSQFTPAGTTINNTAGAPPAPAGGPAAPAAPGAPTAAFGSAGNLPGFQPNSPAAKMTAAGLDQLKKGMGIGDSGGGDEKPPPMQPLPTPPPAMPSGGPMMLGSGGMNTFGRNAAEQQLMQQGVPLQPSMAALSPAPPMLPTPGPAMPGGMTGITGLPGTTLNSPSQLQTAMLYGSLDPFDPYGRYSNASNYGSA